MNTLQNVNDWSHTQPACCTAQLKAAAQKLFPAAERARLQRLYNDVLLLHTTRGQRMHEDKSNEAVAEIIANEAIPPLDRVAQIFAIGIERSHWPRLFPAFQIVIDATTRQLVHPATLLLEATLPLVVALRDEAQAAPVPNEEPWSLAPRLWQEAKVWPRIRAVEYIEWELKVLRTQGDVDAAKNHLARAGVIVEPGAERADQDTANTPPAPPVPEPVRGRLKRYAKPAAGEPEAADPLS